LQEELNELVKKNTLLEEEIATIRKRLYDSEQDKRNEDGQRDMMMRQIKEMEEKEEKRESYIKGIEKQLR
jgi:regulator of replication initiation timing